MKHINKFTAWTLWTVLSWYMFTPIAMAQVDSTVVNRFESSGGRYGTYCEVTVTAAIPICVIELPALATKRVYLEGVTMESTVAGVFTIEQNNTRTGGTLITPSVLYGPTPKANVYSGSTLGAAAAIVTKGKLSADTPHTRGLEGYRMASGKSTPQTIVVTGPSMTGTFRVTAKWGESTY